MQKVIITKIYKTDKDKQGNLLKSKEGKPYTRMSIKTEQYGDKWISGFENKDNSSWKEGDEVEVLIKENGEYLNFETPKKDDKVNDKLELILTKLGKLQFTIDSMEELIKQTAEKVRIENVGVDKDGNFDDIPF